MAEPLIKIFIFKSYLLSCNLYKIKCTILNVYFSEFRQMYTVYNHQHDQDIEHFYHPQKIPLFSLNSHFRGPRQTLICFLSPCGLDLSSEFNINGVLPYPLLCPVLLLA